MVRCVFCGTECTPPFTCRHCGRKFCPECRLSSIMSVSGFTSWQKKSNAWRGDAEWPGQRNDCYKQQICRILAFIQRQTRNGNALAESYECNYGDSGYRFSFSGPLWIFPVTGRKQS